MISNTTTARARLIGLALIVATFLVGALAGAALDRALNAREAPAAQLPVKPCPERVRDTSLLDQIELAPEQRARIDALVARRRAEMDEFWAEAGPRLRAIRDAARAEIRAELTDAQRAEYDRLHEERKALYRSRFEAAQQKESKTQ